MFGLGYRKLDMRPLSGKPKRSPFIFMIYFDPPNGSYVTFGGKVHRTIMHSK